MNKGLRISLSVLVSVVCLVGWPSYAFSVEKIQEMVALSSSDLKLEASQNQMLIGARNFVSITAEQAFDFLGDENLMKEERSKSFRKLLKSSFDMKTIGRFSLGRYWRISTKPQQKEYLQLFEEMVIEVYSRRFENYTSQKLEINGARVEGNADSLVKSALTSANGQKIRIDWRVRYKNGQYRVIDIIVEGVSMALTQRSDFASVIQRGGGQVEVLLTHLRK